MLKIAGVQFIGQADKEANIETAIRLVRQAAAQGARIVCLPELFSTMYFCVETRREYFEWAETIPGPTIERMGAVARETGIVLIAPIFERTTDGRFFNTAAVLGPDGALIGKYRKSSIPFMDVGRSNEPRGNEKFYFEPGDLGFPTFDTPFGRIGILICYDRHFPEGARVLGLGGAEIVFVPTATTFMTRYLWDLELRAHAVTNVYYVCGVNKVGVDVWRIGAQPLRQQHGHQPARRDPGRGERHARGHRARGRRPLGHPRAANAVGLLPRPAAGDVRSAAEPRGAAVRPRGGEECNVIRSQGCEHCA